MNRYDVASVAKFSPLSFNELAAAPTMMRQKHDASIAQAEALRIQADPLKEHSARALEIKNQMDAEIAKNVDILNKEGYNPTTFQNIIKLNRQYNDMISPTGEIGIINAAKIAEAKAKEDFMKNADKSFGQDVLEQRWLEHRQKYADINGRDKDGKIINIDNLGSPKYVDLDTGIKDVLSTLGSTTREKLLNSGLHFQNTDYGPVMVNSQGSVVTETNDKQLNDALNALKTRFINKTGEGRISRDFEGRTADEDLAYINSRISAANVYKQNKDYKTNYDMISTGGSDDKGNSPNGGVFGEDYNTKEVGGKNQDYSDLEKIGKSFGNTDSVGSYYSMGTDTSGGPKQKSGKFTSADIKDSRQKALYEKVFRNATTGKGIMLDGRLVHLSKDMQKFGKDDPRVAAQILRSIKQNPAITLTSKLLTTNQVLNDQGFVAGLGTTADDVDKNIRRQLQRDDASGRKLVDPETGKTISWNDAAKEYDFENINDVNYQGQISAHNWEEDNDKLGSNSSFSPHVVTIKDKKGKWHSFKTTRLNSDNIGGNVARQNDLTKNYRNATVNYGDFVDFESSSNNLKGIQVKYNPNEQEYDSRTGEPKTWTIKFKNGAEEKATESQYMNWVNSIK